MWFVEATVQRVHLSILKTNAWNVMFVPQANNQSTRPAFHDINLNLSLNINEDILEIYDD